MRQSDGVCSGVEAPVPLAAVVGHPPGLVRGLAGRSAVALILVLMVARSGSAAEGAPPPLERSLTLPPSALLEQQRALILDLAPFAVVSTREAHGHRLAQTRLLALPGGEYVVRQAAGRDRNHAPIVEVWARYGQRQFAARVGVDQLLTWDERPTDVIEPIELALKRQAVPLDLVSRSLGQPRSPDGGQPWLDVLGPLDYVTVIGRYGLTREYRCQLTWMDVADDALAAAAVGFLEPQPDDAHGWKVFRLVAQQTAPGILTLREGEPVYVTYAFESARHPQTKVPYLRCKEIAAAFGWDVVTRGDDLPGALRKPLDVAQSLQWTTFAYDDAFADGVLPSRIQESHEVVGKRVDATTVTFTDFQQPTRAEAAKQAEDAIAALGARVEVRAAAAEDDPALPVAPTPPAVAP